MLLTHPGDKPGEIARGAMRVLERRAKTSYKTIHKALRGESIDDRAAAERLSKATRGAVSVAELRNSSDELASLSNGPPSEPPPKRKRAA